MVTFSRYVMAMERVGQRLKKVTRALDEARVPYAVVGGNAVAAHIARINPSGTRTTKDVDLLVDRQRVDEVARVMAKLGFERLDLRGLVLFLDPEEPDKRAGVHLVWAQEPVRPSYVCPAPAVTESERSAEGFNVLSLPALVRMKLTSFRPVDQTHVLDMLGVGLISPSVRQSLPASLLERLVQLEGIAESDEDQT